MIYEAKIYNTWCLGNHAPKPQQLEKSAYEVLVDVLNFCWIIEVFR